MKRCLEGAGNKVRVASTATAVYTDDDVMKSLGQKPSRREYILGY